MAEQRPPPQPPPVVELNRLLNVTIAQLADTRREADTAMNDLMAVFIELHRGLTALGNNATDPLCRQAADLLSLIRQAMGGLQFEDRLSQRIGHTEDTLRGFRETLESPPEKGWPGFWEQIRVLYAMAEDHRILDAVLGGATPDEARPGSGNTMDGPGASRVELF